MIMTNDADEEVTEKPARKPLPYGFGQDQTDSFKASGADLLVRCGSLLAELEPPSTSPLDSPPLVQRERAAILADLRQVEALIECFFARTNSPLKKFVVLKRGGKCVFHLPLVKVISFLAYCAIIKSHPVRDMMTTAQVMAASIDGKGSPASILEARRVLALMGVEGWLAFAEEGWRGGCMPAIRLSPVVLSEICGGEKCLGLVSTERAADIKRRKRERYAKGRKQDSEPAPIPSAKVIFDKLREVVIGQDEACRVLSVAGHLHLQRARLIQVCEDAGGANECILFIGNSGVGKTLLAETYGRIAGVPFASMDSSRFTSTGYVGDSVVEDSIKALLRATKASKKEDAVAKARYGFLFYDEFGKRKSSVGEWGKDVAGAGVQQELLRLMQGTTVRLTNRSLFNEDSLEFNSSGVLFCLADAFVGLNKVLHRLRQKKSAIGFGTKASIRKGTYLSDALISWGLIPELVNRLTGIATFNPLTPSDLARIALSPQGTIATYNALLVAQGLSISLSPKAALLIGQHCVDSGQSARGLRSIVGAMVQTAVFDGRTGAVELDVAAVKRALDRLEHRGA